MDSRLAAINGCVNVNGTLSSGTYEFFAFVPDQDTTITVLEGTDDKGITKNFLTAMSLSGKTLKAGSYYSVGARERITAITVTSGAIVAYKTVDA